MESYAVSDLVKEIKVILDRNQESSALLTPDDSDTLTQGELVESKILAAAKITLMNAPSYKLESDVQQQSGTSKSIGIYYYHTVPLQSDMLRILSVSCSEWNVNPEIITEDDSRCDMLGCKYRVFGTLEHPIAAISRDSSKDRSIRFYVTKSSSATFYVRYVKEPSISGSSISLPAGLKDAIVYMAAYLVCVSLGDMDTANNLVAIAYQLAGITEPTQKK